MFLEKNKSNINYQRIIIKYDDKSTIHYSFRIYKKHPLLKRKISKDKFQNVIDNANNIIYDAKMKKAKFDKVEISNYIYLLFLFFIVIIIIYMFLFYYSPRVDKNQKRIKNTGIFFFCFIIITVFSLEVFNSCRKIEGDKTLFDFYKDDMINYINQLNETYKNNLFFTYDENDKNIICYLKYDNEIKYKNINSEIDNEKCSPQVTQRSNTESDLNSKNG